MTDSKMTPSVVNAGLICWLVNTFARELEIRDVGDKLVLHREGQDDLEYVLAPGVRHESQKESASKTVSPGVVERAKTYIANTPSDGRSREIALGFFVTNQDRTETTVFILTLSLFEKLCEQKSPVVARDGKYRFYPQHMDSVKDDPDVLAAFRLQLV
ncbi:hypothetical protein ACUH9Y_04410 [Dermabacteraceae bacterium P13115]